MKLLPARSSCLWSLLFFALTAVSAPARGFSQEAEPSAVAPKPTTNAAPQHLPTRAEQLRIVTDLGNNGFYDQVIIRATPWIEAAPEGESDPALMYCRGIAEYGIGWYDQAQSDLTYASNHATQAGVTGWLPYLKLVQGKITDLKAQLPLQVEDIKDPANPQSTLFHVYYTQKDTFTQTILDTLLLAYRTNEQMYGCHVTNQTVVIFDTAAHMTAFKQVQGGELNNWMWAFSNLQGLYLCAEMPQGKPVEWTPARIQDTVAHEYNHCLLRRTIGTLTMPAWFVEGIAMRAGAQAAQVKNEENEKLMARLVGAKSLLEPSKLESLTSFKDINQANYAKRLNGDLSVHPSPYIQGYSMTLFLLSKLPDKGLIPFLNTVYQTKSFEQGLISQLGLTLSQFYALWMQDTLDKAAAQNKKDQDEDAARKSDTPPQAKPNL